MNQQEIDYLNKKISHLEDCVNNLSNKITEVQRTLANVIETQLDQLNPKKKKK